MKTNAKQKFISGLISLAVVIIGTMAMIGTASAADDKKKSTASASACQGLGKSTCTGKKDCTWVGGYTTKEGSKVKSYCRSKGKAQKKKATKKKAGKKKASKKKASKKKATKNQATKKKATKKKAVDVEEIGATKKKSSN